MLYPPPLRKNKNKNILPLTFYSVYVEKSQITYKDKLTLKFYWELIRGDGFSRWGITLDGYEKIKEKYLQSHIKKSAPAICLVRDPISVFISAINYGIGINIINNIANNKSDYFTCLANKQFLNKTIAFKSNINQISNKISKYLFIDTEELRKDKAKQTMEKIGEFLNIIPLDSKMLINVNDTFTKCFPYIIKIDNYKILISPFRNDFSITDAEKNIYNQKDTRFYIDENYIPKNFKDRILYISTEKEIKINDEILNKIYIELEKYLQKVESIQQSYEKHKITQKDLFEYLLKNPDLLAKLKSTLIDETSIVKEKSLHIFEDWLYYHEFLEL